jgi:hypothetical protein
MPICLIPFNDEISEIKNKFIDSNTIIISASLIDTWRVKTSKIFSILEEDSDCKWSSAGLPIRNCPGFFYRYLVFSLEAPFEEFICLDADIVVQEDLSFMFDKLSQHDLVVYDYSYIHKGNHIYNTSRGNFGFDLEDLYKRSFCAGVFVSKKNSSFDKYFENFLGHILRGYLPLLWSTAVDQSILNLLTYLQGFKVFNFGLELNPTERTGVCALTEENRIFIKGKYYERGILMPFIHYISHNLCNFKKDSVSEYPLKKAYKYYLGKVLRSENPYE